MEVEKRWRGLGCGREVFRWNCLDATCRGCGGNEEGDGEERVRERRVDDVIVRVRWRCILRDAVLDELDTVDKVE